MQFGNETVRLQTNGSPYPARTFIEACLQFEALPAKVASHPHRSWALTLTSADQSHGKPTTFGPDLFLGIALQPCFIIESSHVLMLDYTQVALALLSQSNKEKYLHSIGGGGGAA